jgi:hypothetical protein
MINQRYHTKRGNAERYAYDSFQYTHEGEVEQAREEERVENM